MQSERDYKREIKYLKDILARAAHIAENLHQMIDDETWKSTGGDDGQGHYEGLYKAADIQQEILMWKEIAAQNDDEE